MVSVGLFVRLRAKKGKEAEVARLLESGLSLVLNEALTIHWFALRFDASTFGIFDSFSGDEGRQAHLAGQLAAALMAKSAELLAERPSIEKVDILTAKT